MSKEKGLICTANSVNAIREGRKTQTRRVMKPQPEYVAYGVDGCVSDCFYWPSTEDIKAYGRNANEMNQSAFRYAPYAVGDRSYVKEAVRITRKGDDDGAPLTEPAVYYIADRTPFESDDYPFERTAMFMPKWAARIWLEVTAIRVERVRDISDADAIAEGFTSSPDKFPAREQFGAAWATMHSLKSWNNDWVWAITFKVTKGAK